MYVANILSRKRSLLPSDLDGVNIGEFKARLGHYMEAVRSGKEVVIMERNRRIAKLIPASESELRWIPAAGDQRFFLKLQIPPLDHSVDSLALLKEERASKDSWKK